MMRCRNCGKKNSHLAFKCVECGKILKRKKGIIGAGLLFAAFAIDVASDITETVLESVFPDDDEVCDTCEDVEVKPSEEPESEKAASTDEDESKSKSEEQIYVASSTADKFHKPDCRWASKIEDSKKITYSSRDEAIADGKTSCSLCDS